VTRAPRPSFFPRESSTFATVELSAWRARTLSSVAMGALAGVALRLLRALLLTRGPGGGWAYLGATVAVSSAVLLGLLALHLANFPVRRWPRHAAVFAAAEVAAEIVTSAALIAAGLEPLGSTGHAGWVDLPSIALRTLVIRAAAITAFALALAGVVQLVRTLLGRRRL
jgi:hypothetical protein